jgi:hypothetical protein
VIGVMKFITAPQTPPISVAPVRVIEFISLYSSRQTQTDSAQKKIFGLGYEYFLQGVQVFFELGSSILCTQLKCL